MQYQAIAVRTLFDEAALHDDEVVQFRCRDGFVASISKDRITQRGAGRSVAYLAIEDPKSKWPDLPVKGASGTAGPFYLVWVRPELSGILQEEWPYQVVAFEIKGKLRDLYPGIFPKVCRRPCRAGSEAIPADLLCLPHNKSPGPVSGGSRSQSPAQSNRISKGFNPAAVHPRSQSDPILGRQ